MTDTADRIRGVLIGLFAGDRNGGPVRMALELAESLRAHSRYDQADVLRRYVAWFQREGVDTGPVAARVFELITRGAAPPDAVVLADQESGGYTAGCNPSHRAAPLAMCAFLPDEHLPALAMQEARLTHLHPLAGDVAAAAVAVCRALVRGGSWDESLAVARAGRQPVTQTALSVVSRTSLQRSGFAPEVLGAALYFVASNTTFEEALSQALEFAGPANYCPVLAGAIAGARWGASAIPQDGYEDDPVFRRVLEVSADLASRPLASIG